MKKTGIWSLILLLVLFGFSFYDAFAIDESTTQKPKVSIVVPVYKVEPWLRKCMESLTNQTLKDIEIICVDDGSPDNSGAILDEYAENDSRVKVIHQKNSGVQMARNAGLDAATGEYIAFVDSDDYVDIHTYETAYNYAKKDNVDILNFGFRKFQNGKDQNNSKIDFSDSEAISKEKYIQNYFRYYVWDNIFKSDIIQKNKIRFVPGIRPSDDTCFAYMALAEAQTVKVIPAQFYNYRIMPGTLSRMSHYDMFMNSYKMFKHICDSWRERGCVENNEHNLLTLIIRWLSGYHETALKHADEILDFFGTDVYNPESVNKCSNSIKDEIKKLEYSAQGNKEPPLENGIYKIKGVKENSRNCLCVSKNNNKYILAFCQPNKNVSTDFEIKKHDEGYYSITPMYSRQKANIQPISDTKWYIVPCGENSFNIISEKNLSAVSVEKNNKQLYLKYLQIGNGSEQLFDFEKVR